MVDKNNRKEVLKEVKRICKSYAQNEEELKKAHDEINRLNDLRETDTYMNCRKLIDDSINVQKDKAMQCLKEMFFFEEAISQLDGRTASIMRQLYIDGISWDFVKSLNGKFLSRDTIARERRKAIAFMADLYPTDRYINWGENQQ